jgi:murein DD-endopeptidase MepM/ murein hydrolase activator NlpD
MGFARRRIQAEVEGIWVRYGRNFLIKYVHVGYPQVKAGEIVRQGQVLGKTVLINGKGFWEISVNLRENNETYADCPYHYFNFSTKNLFLNLWNDQNISRTNVTNPNIPWCDGGKFLVGEKVNPKFWLDKVPEGG